MKIVKVEWIDAVTEYTPESVYLDEITEERLGVMDNVSVGFLIKENENIIILGNLCCRGEKLFKNIHTIPKKLIKKITELKGHIPNNLKGRVSKN